jgi:SAM-dependent methyltransferase
VTHDEAVGLLDEAVRGSSGAWADLGCGSGTFTRALWELLDQPARIMAVDSDPDGIYDVRVWADEAAANVVAIQADFTVPFDPDDLGGRLDGILLANSLHFVADAEPVLARLVATLRPDGRVVVVEYDQRPASEWVPHPVSPARLSALARASGLSEPVISATRPSEYGGELYVARMDVARGLS